MNRDQFLAKGRMRQAKQGQAVIGAAPGQPPTPAPVPGAEAPFARADCAPSPRPPQDPGRRP
jgi:hypothetical protein